jgi:hypothetical protein
MLFERSPNMTRNERSMISLGLFLFLSLVFIYSLENLEEYLDQGKNYSENIRSGELTLSQVPVQERTQDVYENWVLRAPFRNLSDVPDEMVSDFMWLLWVDKLISEDGLDIQLAVNRLERKFSPGTWDMLIPYIPKLLEKHPIALAFLPARLLSQGDAGMYEDLLESDPYWALVGSGHLPPELLHAIPLQAWATAVKNSGSPYIEDYLPCELTIALIESGHTQPIRAVCDLGWW